MDTFKWIKDFTEDNQTNSGLKDLIPNHFDRYLLIPWTVGIIENFPFADYPDSKDTIENINTQHTIEKQFGIFLNRDTEAKYRETTLKEIAERFNVKYCADTDYLIKLTPGTSPLLLATTRKLTELVEGLNCDNELNLFVEDNFRFQVAFNDWKFLEENTINEFSDYLTFQQQIGWDTTTYLFPQNIKWCLCTVESFDHFIFCSDNSIYATIKEMTSFETFEVNYDFMFDRVLWRV